MCGFGFRESPDQDLGPGNDAGDSPLAAQSTTAICNVHMAQLGPYHNTFFLVGLQLSRLEAVRKHVEIIVFIQPICPSSLSQPALSSSVQWSSSTSYFRGKSRYRSSRRCQDRYTNSALYSRRPSSSSSSSPPPPPPPSSVSSLRASVSIQRGLDTK